MRKVIFVVCCLVILNLLSSCSSKINYENTSEINKEDESKIITSDSLNDITNYSYKAEDQLRCITVINSFFESQLSDDYDLWISTMSDRKKSGFNMNSNGEFGILRMELKEISFPKESEFENTMLSTSQAEEMHWNKNNTIVIQIDYIVEYDHTIVPHNDGMKSIQIFLAKSINDLSWVIEEWNN